MVIVLTHTWTREKTRKLVGFDLVKMPTGVAKEEKL